MWRNFCISHSAFSGSAAVPMMRPQNCGCPLSRYRREIAVCSLTYSFSRCPSMVLYFCSDGASLQPTSAVRVRGGSAGPAAGVRARVPSAFCASRRPTNIETATAETAKMVRRTVPPLKVGSCERDYSALFPDAVESSPPFLAPFKTVRQAASSLHQVRGLSKAVPGLPEPQGVLSIKDVGPRTPQMPEPRWTGSAQVAASAVVHVFSAFAIVLVMKAGAVPAVHIPPSDPLRVQPTDVRHVVFLVREPQTSRGGGGGGGGNHQTGPIRRAHGKGSDAMTLRTAKPARTTEALAEFATTPAVLLDARPLMSGVFDQIGLPDSGVEQGTSTGPGLGGGIGTGAGTGIGPGEGPGIGPGSGGGIGGGIHLPGGAVTAPRVLV